MSTPDVRGLRLIERADVYKAGQHAGSLRRDGDAVVFDYAPDYLADSKSPPVAVSLPKRDAPVRATGGAVPPFFAGLLPEGLRLQAVIAAARTSSDDHLTLLLAVGGDTIGDVQIVADGMPPAEPKALFDPASAAEEDFEVLFARAIATDPDLLDRVALPGVQVKVSASVISTPVGSTTGPSILKLNPREYPQLVENEHFFLAMASDCGLPVPSRQLLRDKAGRAGLLVTRFDREIVGGEIVGGEIAERRQLRRLAQEDACQVLGRYPAAKYRISLQEAVIALADAVAEGGGSRPLALRRLLELAAFSYLIGNGDLHGKNLSIRQAPSGLWEVTPAYDLVSTQPYLGWHDPMALPLFGRANRLGRRWWVDAAKRLGLPEKAVSRALDRIVDASRPWLDQLGDMGFDAPTTDRLRDVIRARRGELAG